MQKIDVFISHADTDKQLVKPLVEALLRDGYSIFIDNPFELKFTHEEITAWEDTAGIKLLYYLKGGNEPWTGQLMDALEKAGVVLGVLSPSIMEFRKVLYQEMILGHGFKKLFLRTVDGGPGQDALTKFFLDEDGAKPCLFEGNAQQIIDIDTTILEQLIARRGSGEWLQSNELISDEERECYAKYSALRTDIHEKIGWSASGRPSQPDAVSEACKNFFIDHIGKLSEAARKAFIGGLRDRVSINAAHLLQDNKINDLAAELAPANIVDILGAVGSALATLRKSASVTASDFEGLRRLASAVAPIIAELRGAEIGKVERSVGTGGFTYVELDIGAYTMAEIIVAASGKRPVRMHERSSQLEDPCGELALLLGGDNGPDDVDGVYTVADFIAEVLARSSSIAADVSIDERIQSDGSEIKKRIWQTVKDRLGYFKTDKRLERHLRQARRAGSSSHYLLVRVPKDKGGREHLKTVLKHIHEELPSMLMLVIGAAEEYEHDEDLLETFWFTLRD